MGCLVPIQTKPEVLGAPLDPQVYFGSVADHAPSPLDIDAELERAKVELMHAIARHRKAWSKVRKHGAEARARSIWAESYPPYQEAIGDVRWWREEMAAQAATVTALTALLR